MARISKRDQILAAIVAIIEREGLTALTLDAVAAETGMTRAGLLYHFPSREALIRATHEHLSQSWEREMQASAGKSHGEASAKERHDAYIRVAARAARRVELLLMLETTDNPELGELWQQVMDRWAAPIPDAGDDQAVMCFIARLAADGLWSFEALAAKPLPEELKARIIDRLITLSGGEVGSKQ